MGDYRTGASNTPANPSSCPYPIAAGGFPMPSTTETNDDNHAHVNPVPVGMSPYYRDRIVLPEEVAPTGVSTHEAARGHTRADSVPSAPYANGNSEGQWPNTRSTIGFSNPMADEPALNPSDPPPSYNDLFATPKNEIRPNPVSNGTAPAQRPATSPRAIVVPRIVTATGNRIITHAPVQLIGVRSNARDSYNGVWVVIIATLIIALAIFIVFINARR